ncbi:MAG: hypothetical protein US52_C0004G0008 [candidate division WS6 bacterium GW2011_GWA2_37_6]|uniref:Uncharacterized protein n=1 Tax=candidate division WS6 bacterium GW2011_GWA2_37_6 TaxID=1619087 RepID=A0A0G0H263_9BACT|nr:MAG: hypothetical protein US52_C0004G0008 [candidate division WS6 bacterium GW2011_GWA2_37_6]
MILFFVFLLLVATFGMVYKRFRSRMSKYIKKEEGGLEIYNYKVLLKFFVLFALIPFIPIVFMGIFINVYGIQFPENDLQLLLFLLSQVTFSFSIGIYFTSIVIERFVAREIKQMKEYKSLRIAIKFFHGPVSHVGIYMGIILWLFSLSPFEKFSIQDFDTFSTVVIVLIGLLVGFILGIEQRANLTWRYQRFAFLFYAIIFLILILGPFVQLRQEFSVFNVSFLSGALVYFAYKSIRAIIRKEKNLYSEEFWWV